MPKRRRKGQRSFLNYFDLNEEVIPQLKKGKCTYHSIVGREVGFGIWSHGNKCSFVSHLIATKNKHHIR